MFFSAEETAKISRETLFKTIKVFSFATGVVVDDADGGGTGQAGRRLDLIGSTEWEQFVTSSTPSTALLSVLRLGRPV